MSLPTASLEFPTFRFTVIPEWSSLKRSKWSPPVAMRRSGDPFENGKSGGSFLELPFVHSGIVSPIDRCRLPLMSSPLGTGSTLAPPVPLLSTSRLDIPLRRRKLGSGDDDADTVNRASTSPCPFALEPL